MTERLKPCPFCDGEAEAHDDTSSVECKACGIGTGVRDNAKEAIAAWNRRTEHRQEARH